MPAARSSLPTMRTRRASPAPSGSHTNASWAVAITTLPSSATDETERAVYTTA